jgi:hypothetical protein
VSPLSETANEQKRREKACKELSLEVQGPLQGACQILPPPDSEANEESVSPLWRLLA